MKSQGNTRHGMRHTAEYAIFYGAKRRCENPNDIGYYKYGGRGIRFRFNCITELIADIGLRPSPKHSLNRIDNNGHYEAGNVEWATVSKQARNKRNNVLLTIDDTTQCASAWAEKSPVAHRTILERYKRGWCARCAVKSSHNQRCRHIR